LKAARDAIMEEQRIKLEAIMEEQRSIRESTNTMGKRLVAVQKRRKRRAHRLWSQESW